MPKKKRGAGAKNRIPLLSNLDIVADLTRPLPPEAVQAMATKLVQFKLDIADYRETCRTAFTAGKKASELPPFPVSKLPNPNAGRMSRAAYSKLVADYNEAIEDDRTPPLFPPRYCPVEVDMVQLLGCTVIRRGQAQKPPREWNDKRHGPWYHKNPETGERDVCSGWVLDSSRQRGCHQAVDKMVNDPDNNIVTLKNARYVIGAGPKASDAALNQMDCSKRGSYGAIWDVRRRICMAKSRLTNVVFRIEDHSSNGGAAVKVAMGGVDNYFMPGDCATPGHLVIGDKELTAGQIRKAVADDTNGIRFKPLKEMILGDWISLDETFPEIKKAFKASKKDATILNSLVQCRVSHDEGYPFGFRAASVGIVPCFRWLYDGNSYSLEMNLAVGTRTNVEINVSKLQARAEWNAAHVEEEAVEVTAKPKPLKAKKTAKPKTAAKSKAKTKAKAVTSEAKKATDKPELTLVVVDEPDAEVAAPIVDHSEDVTNDEEAALDANQRELTDAALAESRDD